MISPIELSNKQIALSMIVVVLALAASLATCNFATPTVFGGRDQGAIATAAINLAKYKSFTFSTPVSRDLFQKYGPGKALNFPGSDYTKTGELTTRFPKAFIVYLACLYSIFGVKGIQFANFLPLFLFLILFWLTLRHFFTEKISFLGFLITATFFPYLWFAKYALTEIFMLALVWTGVYFLLKFFETPTGSGRAKSTCLAISFAALGLSALTRIEGMIFFLLAIGYVFMRKRKKKISLPSNFEIVLLVATLFLFILYVTLNYLVLIDSVKNIAKLFLPQFSKDSRPSVNLYSNLLRLFANYNLLAYLAIGLAGILSIVSKWKKYFSAKIFLPLFLLFPAFFYLISPAITLDDPWIFRRYVFAVFPLLIFYSIWALENFFVRKFFLYAALVTLIAANCAVSLQFVTISENKALLPEVETIARQFTPQDLILVDRLSSGSGFSLVSDPLFSLYNRQAVYFFNADDLKFISRDKYRNIYLVAPVEQEDSWYDHIDKKLLKSTRVKNNFLVPSRGFFHLARNEETETEIGVWRIN